MQLHLPSEITLDAEFYDRTPFVRGILNGKPVLFLFDSGAQGLTLSSRYFQPEEKEHVHTASGATGRVEMYSAYIEELSFGDWSYRDTRAQAIDLSHAEKDWGVEVQGILGFRQLIHSDWMVDYQNAKIHLWRDFDRKSPEILAFARLRFQSAVRRFSSTSLTSCPEVSRSPGEPLKCNLMKRLCS